jgi:hypothetical protein
MRLLNLSRLAILVLVLAVTSCQKRGDFEVSCKIESFTDNEGNVATFNYNIWGDPVSIIESNSTTGKPNYYFEYDNKKRLISYTASYANGAIESYTKYHYNSSNFIISDTTFFVKDPYYPRGWLNVFLTNYTYDSKGRVTKVATEVLDIGAHYESNYAYDANGNLIRDGFTYSNKTNYLRTSLVLAFINRNYSMNSQSNATTYNAKKLPTAFDNSNFLNQTRFMNMTISSIDYSCDNH